MISLWRNWHFLIPFLIPNHTIWPARNGMPLLHPLVCRQSLAILAPLQLVVMWSHAIAIDFGTCKYFHLSISVLSCFCILSKKKKTNKWINEFVWVCELPSIFCFSQCSQQLQALSCTLWRATQRYVSFPTILPECVFTRQYSASVNNLKFIFNYSSDSFVSLP